ncbi:MAG TPA: lasso peptide biosynthesis B2 protein [Steroidobacteraceae bacterium]
MFHRLTLRPIQLRRIALLLEALAWLFVLRLAISHLPFRLIAARVGTCVEPEDDRVRQILTRPPDPTSVLMARTVGWAVACSARKLPFSTACLHQAIAARRMLNRRHVATVLHLGASCESGFAEPLEAHAWLEAAGAEITGYPAARKFVAIASFV